jgi:hypothetical protein
MICRAAGCRRTSKSRIDVWRCPRATTTYTGVPCASCMLALFVPFDSLKSQTEKYYLLIYYERKILYHSCTIVDKFKRNLSTWLISCSHEFITQSPGFSSFGRDATRNPASRWETDKDTNITVVRTRGITRWASHWTPWPSMPPFCLLAASKPTPAFIYTHTHSSNSPKTTFWQEAASTFWCYVFNLTLAVTPNQVPSFFLQQVDLACQ